jgi:sec-independent protein translocase protein TatB
MGLDLGFFEILVILIVALLVVGPEKLPEYARKFGKMVRDLRKLTKNFTGEVPKSLDLEDDFDDLKSTAQGLKGSLDEESLKIKNALDMEADEIAKTIDNEINDVQKTMDDETAELSAMLEKESLELDSTARDIKDPLATGAHEVSMALNEGADKLSKSLNLDNDSPSKKTRTTAARKTTAKKAAETPEKLDTVENSEPQEESVAAPAGETALPDEKKDTEEAGK